MQQQKRHSLGKVRTSLTALTIAPYDALVGFLDLGFFSRTSTYLQILVHISTARSATGTSSTQRVEQTEVGKGEKTVILV